MNKQQIIQSIAYADVPEGTSLVEHDTGKVMFSVLDASNIEGVKIIAARMLARVLEQRVADLPDLPNSNLFLSLHRAVLEFHQVQISSALFEAVEDEIKETHQKVIERLREIAQHLGISYTEPEDPILRREPGKDLI